jgi:hypothetical protein
VVFLGSAGSPPTHRKLRRCCVRRMVSPAAFAFAIVLVAACIAAGGASAQIQPSDNQANIIRGTVLNFITHEPIGRALVHSTDDKFAMLTDGEGHFEFALPKAEAETGDFFTFEGQARPVQVHGNTFWLVAHKPGFLDDANGINQIGVTPGNDVTISLIPEALIQGRVTLSTNDAATGITVQLFIKRVQEGMPRWVPAAMARANSNGEYRFAELQPGAYKMVAHELLDNDPVTTDPVGNSTAFRPPITQT